ncbi:MAG: MoaD/ThiS family protein [Verrucomicrobiota bacterium]
MQLKLLAFAQAHDLLGFQERLVEVEPEETPRRLLGRLAPLFDAAGVRVAIDCEYCSWDTPIGAQARELAIIPPVSGG